MNSRKLSDWVTLDVGGRILSTSRATLCACPGSMLSNMFSPQSNLEPARQNKDGLYTIDCDPDMFTVILNWLRYKQVMLPTYMSKETVRVVAEYFSLAPLVSLLTPSPRPSPSFPEIIPLDVRGRKLNVNRSFLTRYPTSYLGEMFSNNSRYTPAKLSDGSFSIDADPECFSVLLNFLQYDRVMLPSFGGPNIEDIKFVANEFGLGNEISQAFLKSESRLDNAMRSKTFSISGSDMDPM